MRSFHADCGSENGDEAATSNTGIEESLEEDEEGDGDESDDEEEAD